MVSKLLLAVMECCLKAIEEGADDVTIGKLLEHYYEIQAGIGVHKSPKLYGAFPTDPYSHTPWHKGAQQPGMTGQVKEDLLARMGEMGVHVKAGKIYFDPQFLRVVDLLKESTTVKFVDVQGQFKSFDIAPHSLFFTYGQVPVVYQLDEEDKIVVLCNGQSIQIKSNHLDQHLSQKIFGRTGEVTSITVHLTRSRLKN